MALTALPLPEDDESDIEAATAIELDKKDTLIECPLCFHLINPHEAQCSVYLKYLEHESRNDLTDSSILEEYKSIGYKAQQNFYLGFVALIYGLGIFIGPWVVWNGLRLRPLLCPNLEAENRKMLDAGILMGIIGIASTLFILLGLL